MYDPDDLTQPPFHSRTRREIGLLPFGFNPRSASKKARLLRLQRKGLTPATDKQSLREAAQQAAASHPISRV